MGAPLVVIAFYISGHGFGHAARDIEVLNTIGRRRPEIRLQVRSAVPRRVFDLGADVPLTLEPVEADTGMAQIDSLRVDEVESARRAAAFYATFDRRVDAEARALRAAGVTVVVGDIPPLAFAAASAAAIPSIALGNFTWDWIYESYPVFSRDAGAAVASDPDVDVLALIRRSYGQATRALRLPLHGGFGPMAAVTCDIPFIARRSERDPADTRRELQLGEAPAALASFGGHAMPLSYDEIARRNRCTVVVTDHEAATTDGHGSTSPLRLFNSQDLKARGIRYEDLVAACDVVVSKPGYGIVSECIANDTPLLYTSRDRFPEQEVFLADMPALLPCRFIGQDDLFAGRWDDHIARLLEEPAPVERPRVDGADVAATSILEFLGT